MNLSSSPSRFNPSPTQRSFLTLEVVVATSWPLANTPRPGDMLYKYLTSATAICHWSALETILFTPGKIMRYLLQRHSIDHLQGIRILDKRDIVDQDSSIQQPLSKS